MWHHYAIVIDTTAASANEITPYVDGQPVSYPAGRHSQRPGHVRQLHAVPDVARRQPHCSAAGTLDQLAIYNQALSAEHGLPALQLHGTDKAAEGGLHDLPESSAARAKRDVQRVGLDRSGRLDHRLPWDLNGDGIYETDIGL